MERMKCVCRVGEVLLTALVAGFLGGSAEAVFGAAAPEASTAKSAFGGSRWPGGVVYYELGGLTAGQEAAFRAAADEWQAAVNCDGGVCEEVIRFVERTDQPDYIEVRTGSGDRSCAAIGRQGGPQKFDIVSWHRHRTLLHELGHTLGLTHEQKRSDRDQYVEIRWENVGGDSDDIRQFEHDPGSANYSSYDFRSIMHYSATNRTVNPGEPIIVPTEPYREFADVLGGDPDCATDPDVDCLTAADVAGVKQRYSANPLDGSCRFEVRETGWREVRNGYYRLQADSTWLFVPTGHLQIQPSGATFPEAGRVIVKIDGENGGVRLYADPDLRQPLGRALPYVAGTGALDLWFWLDATPDVALPVEVVHTRDRQAVPDLLWTVDVPCGGSGGDGGDGGGGGGGGGDPGDPPAIGGRITDAAGQPIEGVRIDGMPAVHWTDAGGVYGRVVGDGWSGTVTPSKAGFSFEPPQRSYTNVTASRLGEDFVASGRQLLLSGRITAGAAGLGGVVLDGLPGPPVTAADGTYSVQVPFRFTGRVTPRKASYVFTPPFLEYDDLRGARVDQDYSAAVEAVTLSGRVTRGASGLAGVWLAGLPGGVVTAADGTYAAPVPRGWTGAVTPRKTGFVFTPPSRDYAAVQGGEPGDYAAVPAPPGSHRLWLVAADDEMRDATTWNRTGDLILVEPGTYLDVDAGGLDPGVTLLSTGGAGVTVLRRNGDHRFSEDDVTVDGFTFETVAAVEPVQVFGDRVEIRNSRFKPPAGEYSLRLTSASDVLLEGNVFDVEDGILLRSGSAAGELVVRNNAFRNLGAGVDGGSNSGLRVRIENNLFEDVRNPVDLSFVREVTVRNNVFAGVASQGVDLDDVALQSSLAHNTFYQNAQAIAVCDVSVLVFDSIFQDNAKSIDGCSRATVNVHHDLIWQGTWLWAGPTYIEDPSTIWRDFWDPLFLDPAGGDFRLAPSSQARGRGTGGSDLGAFGGALGDAWRPVPGTPQAPPAFLDLRLEGRGELNVGDVVAFSAEADFEGGFYAPLTREAAWTSSDGAVLRPLGNGRFEALAPGSAAVTASWDGHSRSAPVEVLAPSPVLSAVDTPDPATAGGSVLYTLSWRNDGPGTARAARLRAAYDPRTANPSPSRPADPGTVDLWTLGDLPPGASGTFTVRVDVDPGLVEGDVLSFTATLEADALAALAATATTAVEGTGDLSVTKTCNRSRAFPGDRVTCFLAWRNDGDGTAPGVRLVETYPVGTTFLGARPEPSSGDALWLFGDAPPGAEGSVAVDLRIDGDAAGEIVNRVEVLADEPDGDASDNAASFTIEVTPRPDPPPSVVRVDVVTGGELDACATTRAEVTAIRVTFSETLRDTPGHDDPDDVTHPANFPLLAAGADQDFSTDLCGTLFGDDLPVAVDGVTWNGAGLTATLTFAGGASLDDGKYRLMVCGSTSLYDLAGQPLDGDADGTGGDDFLLDFRVDRENLFANGRLDCGLDPWLAVSTHPDEVLHAPEDAAGSSVSGSVRLTNLTASTDFVLGQCVEGALPRDLELAARARLAASPGTSAVLSGQCDFFPQAGCGGAVLGAFRWSSSWTDTGGRWLDFAVAGEAPAGSMSATCGYDLVVPGAGGFDLLLDDLVLRDACTGPDADGDGIADVCDVCPDGVLDGCGICGGDHSSCGIFLDGFESGTASAWR